MEDNVLEMLDIVEIIDQNPDQDKEFYMSYINAAFEDLDQSELSARLDEALLFQDLPCPGEQAVS